MLLWVAIVGGIISFVLAWSLGANDVANAFGTSVGSQVLSLRQAIVIASIVEFAGAVLMGSHVVDTMRKGIIKPELYADEPDQLMLGMLAVLIGSTMWLLLATFLSLPVSTTHSMVGGIVGITLVAIGGDGVDWWEIGKIAISWVSSPILAGLVSCAMFVAVRFFILRRENSLKLGFRFLPFFYGVTLGALCFFIMYKGSPGLGLSDLPIWLVVTICLSVGIGSLIVCWLVGVPLLRRYIDKKFDENGIPRKTEEKHGDKTENQHLGLSGDGLEPFEPVEAKGFAAFLSKTSVGRWILSTFNKVDVIGSDSAEGSQVADETSELSPPDGENSEIKNKNKCCSILSMKSVEPSEMYTNSEVFDSRTEELFSFLQILTACVGGFAHGANDVSNAIAPFVVIISIHQNGDVSQEDDVAWWVLLMGGAGIVLGLAMWGHRVMATIGKNMTKLTSSRGFNIEFGASMTVLVASRLKIPVSTTHCIVGSVFAVGLTDGLKAVNWRLLVNIFLSWVVTLPASALAAAGVFALLRLFYD